PSGIGEGCPRTLPEFFPQLILSLRRNNKKFTHRDTSVDLTFTVCDSWCHDEDSEADHRRVGAEEHGRTGDRGEREKRTHHEPSDGPADRQGVRSSGRGGGRDCSAVRLPASRIERLRLTP